MRTEAALSERRVIRYVCAKTGGRFLVRFQRDTPEGRFTIKAIEKTAPAPPGGLFGSLLGKAEPEVRAYAAKDFDRTGWHCPYCEAKGSTIYCDECGQNVCSGRTRILPNGDEFFVCHDACGAAGGLETTDEIRGSKGHTHAPALEGPKRQARLGQTVMKRLEGPKR
ncbi:MAG: hypothetical protein J0H65_13755 [Rhizobiales bacterium]|nr:hypothetical protein [Hyphomicrobiales bacterium]